MEIPEKWSAEEEVSPEALYIDPPAHEAPSRFLLIGLKNERDLRHRFYSLPIDTPTGEIVHYFNVGSHDQMEEDSERIVAMVADLVEEICEVIPGQIVFADSAGLKVRFSRPVTFEDAEELDDFLDDPMAASDYGLSFLLMEGGWNGEPPVLAPLIGKTLLHLLWDW